MRNSKRQETAKCKVKQHECRGRMQCMFPICIPSSSALSEKIIFSGHRKSLHEGETANMVVILDTSIEKINHVYYAKLLWL